MARALLAGQYGPALERWKTIREELPDDTPDDTPDDLARQMPAACSLPKRVLSSLAADRGKAVRLQLIKGPLAGQLLQVSPTALRLRITVRRNQGNMTMQRTVRLAKLSLREEARPLDEALLFPMPHEPWTVPELGVELVRVKEGSFMMGSGSHPRSSPVHRVRLTRPFWIGKCEVTQAQYEQVMKRNPSGTKGANLPVEYASWTEATEFCRQVTTTESDAGRLPGGCEYRLPTEAEWEYCARGGADAQDTLYAGSNYLDGVGWVGMNSGEIPHPVGTKQPNELGIHDMTGSVREWCLDGQRVFTRTEVADPTGPLGTQLKAVRDASSLTPERSGVVVFTIPYRTDQAGADFVAPGLGFRVALAPVIDRD